MISTFQALLVAVIALLPGATYMFAVERFNVSYGLAFADRLVRFLAASAAFAAVFAGPAYVLHNRYIRSGELSSGHVSWWLVEVVAIVYVAFPATAGSLVGYGRTQVGGAWKWARWVSGDSIEPRAWDYFWRVHRNGVVRMHLKSGTWLAGLHGYSTGSVKRSYASGHPEPGDVYLYQSLLIDPGTGALVVDQEGRAVPVPGAPGLLIRWDEIEYLDVLEA